MIEVIQANTRAHYKSAHRLFVRYANSLDFDLGFQDFGRELATLPGDYAPPGGCILLARAPQEYAGCVAMRPMEDSICEMKRLYVDSGYRGRGVGRLLAQTVIGRAGEAGYKKMRLDTIESMKEANALYLSLGFHTIEAYRYNPLENAIYMELIIETASYAEK
jgi:ribosomal protein S18 acetylase RimI-like enzyme